MPVTGLGLSAEYAYNEEHEHDGALYLSGRYGFIWMVSGFLTADAGIVSLMKVCAAKPAYQA